MSQSLTVKLSAIKLPSGKYQVKFKARNHNGPVCYGYLLAEAQSSEEEVWSKVEKGLTRAIKGDLYQHGPLYSLGQTRPHSDGIMVYKSVLA